MLKRTFIGAATALVLGLGWNGAQAQIPTTAGWHEIPNSHIRSVCAADNGFPQIAATDGCPGITLAWNGGVYDTTRNRLIIWGGGHNDYGGNEIYAVNLDTQTVQRLTDPGLPEAPSTPCMTSVANGTQPNARHTYSGIQYMPNVDRMFVFGGSLFCSNGGFGNDTWTFSFATNTWQNMNPTGTIPDAIPGIVTAYDPNTGLVYLYDDLYFYSYDPKANVFTRLTSTQQPIGYNLNGAIDPKRKKFIMVGWDSVQAAGRVWSVDISSGSTYKLTAVPTTGGDTVVSANYPGVEYDPVTDKMVAWAEGTPNVVYSLNLDTNTWTTQTFSGGPTPVGNGTHGRWRYSPKYDLFVLANSVDANVTTVRLAAGSSTPDTTAPSVPGSLSGTPGTSPNVALTWSAATDNVAVTGYRVYRCTGTSCTPATQIGAPTATSYTDATGSPGATYRYAVTAVDAAGNASPLSAVATVTVAASSSGAVTAGATVTADADYAARCAAPGVIKCVGFDNTTADIVQNVNLWPDGKGTFRAGLDTSQKASGGGSLRFDLPPPPNAGANIAGRWAMDSGTVFGQTFSQNSTFYVQFRIRLSPEMINPASWPNYNWKTVIFHYNTQTCGSIELTTSNYYGNSLAQMDTQCGSQHMYTTLDGSQYNEAPPLLQQQGDFPNCSYGNISPTNCFYFPANEWVTLYYKVHVGTWDQPNSTIEAFEARSGATSYKQWIKVINFPLSCDAAPCSASPGAQQGYNNLTFTPYMTGLDGSIGPSTTAHMWIDELVVSTQPIAVPESSGQAAPMAPGNVLVK